MLRGNLSSSTIQSLLGSKTDFAVAGGNVCAIAQKKGNVIGTDGVIRDLAEMERANSWLWGNANSGQKIKVR